MQEFIDLVGASGQRYRFRVWPAGTAHLPMAGNYAYVRAEAKSFTVVAVGVSENLGQVSPAGANGAAPEATHLFTRLNVSRATRTAEQDDLAANYKAA